MVQNCSEKETSPDKQKEKRKKHVWLSGGLHIEGRLNEGPRLQRNHKDEKRSKAKQSKAKQSKTNVTPEKDVMTSANHCNITIPATHMRGLIRSKYCSEVTQDLDTEEDPVFVSNKYIIPAAHEALIRVSSTARPQKDTLALIEPKIATPDTIKDIPQDEVWHALIVARTATHYKVYKN